MQELSIYVHWPFCLAKCPYCDFNSHVREKISYKDWLDAYLNEIKYFKPQIEGKKIKSIFFGGGTPSLMPAEITYAIINSFKIDDNTEITLEANPTSIESKKFHEFKQAGINRLSVGIQSLNNDDLKFLGRKHSAEMAIESLLMARKIFNNYSFDLIYARPNQSVKEWEDELLRALKYAGDHLSLYQLTIEKGTQFYSLYNKGVFLLPNEDTKALLYELTNEIMKSNNRLAYEISNYAKPGKECKHNLAYWQYDDYLGIGPGAHSRINNRAIMNIHNPENWLSSIGRFGHAMQNNTELTLKERFEELILMNLRLTNGIDKDQFRKKLNCSYEELFDLKEVSYLVENNLLIDSKNNIRASASGLLVLNKVVEYLITRCHTNCFS